MKRKLAVLCLAAASMLVVYGVASAGIVDPCASSAALVPTGGATPGALGLYPLFICPQGDTDNYVDQVGGASSGVGYYIAVTVIDNTAQPIPNIPGSDFWAIDCDPLNDVALCGGSASTGADSLTNAMGMTTIGGFGTTAGGGCADGYSVVVQGFVIENPGTGCTTDLCLNIAWRSPDINGDLIVNLVDLSAFASGYPPQSYVNCSDFDNNGLVNLQDLSKFAFHYGPPGHQCG